MSEHGYLKDEALFVDGTKVEADANKYSFVWRKAVEKYEAKLDADIKALYDELIERKVTLAMAEDELKTSQALNLMIQAAEARIGTLDEVIEAEAKAIKGGSANKRERRTIKKHLRKLVTNFILERFSIK